MLGKTVILNLKHLLAVLFRPTPEVFHTTRCCILIPKWTVIEEYGESKAGKLPFANTHM